MTAGQWIAALAANKEWREAYATIEQETKAFLDAQPPTAFFSSVSLVEELFPLDEANEEAQAPRQRLFRGLAACARYGLASYCQHGDPIQLFGKTARRLIWRKPKAL